MLLQAKRPLGAIEMQAPYFKTLALDLSNLFQATLNLNIDPNTFEVICELIDGVSYGDKVELRYQED